MIAVRKFLSVLVLIAATNCVAASNNMADLAADPCGKLGKLCSAAVGIGASLFENSFEQDTLVYTRVLTHTSYQTKLKTIRDTKVGDEVMAWDELQAHDNARPADLTANLGAESTSRPIITGASSYKSNSNLNS